MKKLFFLISCLILTSTVYATTFTIKTPSNTVLKFDGNIVSTTGTVNITTSYLPSITLTKAQLIDLQDALNMLGTPSTTSTVQITVTLDSSAIQILKKVTTGVQPIVQPSVQPVLKVSNTVKKK